MVMISACTHSRLPEANGKYLNPDGDFTLHINNLSEAINPVDIRVLINDELVVSEYIPRTGDQYDDFQHIKMSLPKGNYRFEIYSDLGATTNISDVVITNQNAGLIGFWFAPHYGQTNAHISFNTFEGELMLD